MRSLHPLTSTALSLALLASPLALSPATAAQEAPIPIASREAAPQEGDREASPTVLASEHTDALALSLVEGQLKLFTYADLPGAPRTPLNPATTIFNLPDRAETKVSVPAGFDFLGAQGETIWLAPQTQIQGILWPGWNTEDIRPGELAEDSLDLELLDAKAPDGAWVEVFQSSLTGTTRVFSSREELPAYQQAVGSHVHANWAFSQLGTYELTFRASAIRADGTPVSTEETYTFVIGPLPSETGEEGSQEVPETPQPSPSSRDEENREEASASPSAPTASLPPTETPDQQLLPAEQEPAEPTDSPLGASPESSTRIQDNQLPPAPVAGKADQTPTARTAQEGGQGQQAAGNTTRAAVPQQCLATEELVKPAQQAQEGDVHQADRIARQTLDKPTFTIQKAVNTATDRVASGHFDFGPVVNGNKLSAQVKDDRTSPAIWKQPDALTFVLGQESKTTMPEGMSHIAPAGSEIYFIGATQQPQVPWLGWNTQHPELLAQASGPATLTLTDLKGPGKLSVFLSGNFGAAGTTVFDKVGDSFSVPLNTHQHANWVFTAPGTYSAVLTWSVPLKNGTRASASGTLNFEVNPAAQAQAEGGSEKQDSGRSADSEAAQSRSQGSIDSSSGLVTRPDGSQVHIVGKTPDGHDCTLSEEELKKAQEASARGQLAYTGTSATGLTILVGALTLLTGAGLLLLVRRHFANRAA